MQDSGLKPGRILVQMGLDWDGILGLHGAVK